MAADGFEDVRVGPSTAEHAVDVLIARGETHVVRQLAFRLERSGRHDAANTEALTLFAYLVQVFDRVGEFLLARTEDGWFDERTKVVTESRGDYCPLRNN